jgi:transposase InsO family protein
MPWKDKTVEELRKEFVEAAKVSKNLSSLCREFGISRKTGYKWIERNNQSLSLSDRSHTPFHIPGKTPAEIENAILQIRFENPEWGAKTILRVLENNGYTDLPCIRTANNILQRNGCISETESEKRKEFLRFQREYCNELWQIDFKGDFPLLDGTRCFPLDIIDDRSRFCIGIFPKNNTLGVTQSVELAFREFGLPKAILSDNGGQFAGFRGGYTQFERWLMDLDVLPIHGRPLHPQTQGKIERFHRTMKNELIKRNAFIDLADAKKHLREWRTKYNEIRPHEALDMLCPADVYIPSERKYPDKIKPYEYSGMHRILKVNFKGYLRFDSMVFYLSKTMIGAELGLRINDEYNAWLCYRNYKIAEIDLRTEQLLNRRIFRLE